MFEQLAKSLARKHQVDVISAYPLKSPPANYTDLFKFSIDVEQMVNNLTYTSMKLHSLQELIVKVIASKAGNELCEGLNLPEMQKLISNPPDPPYDALLTQVKNKIK